MTCSSPASRQMPQLALLLLLFAAYALTLREGHRWGDDYAAYIHHAKNIATGLPYADIGYIADPYYPVYGPRIAPPVFPLLLAPVYRLFGMNLRAFKMEEVVFFIAALAVLLALVRDHLSPPYRLLLLALAGCNPFFWNAKDDVLSDIPFLFFVLLTALLIEKRQPALVCGFAAYFAIGARTIGIVLLPAILLHEWLHHRRITRYAIAIAAVSSGLLLLQFLLLRDDAALSYRAQFHPSLHTLLTNPWNYRGALGAIWQTPFARLSALIYVVAFLLSAAGLAGRQPRFLAGFACLYGATLVIWPGIPDPRFLTPIFPLFLFYVVRGIERLDRRAALAVCLLLAGAYILEYRTEIFPTISEANGRGSFVAMCSFVQSHTAPGDRFVFNRARSLSLFADRPASPYHEPGNPEDLWRYFRNMNIQYVVVSPLFEKDRRVLAPILAAHMPDLDLQYENPEFRVYRIRR